MRNIGSGSRVASFERRRRSNTGSPRHSGLKRGHDRSNDHQTGIAGRRHCRGAGLCAARTCRANRCRVGLKGRPCWMRASSSPSDRRVAAPCRHYKSCGGCQLQHGEMTEFVADWKVDVVRALRWNAHGLETHFRARLTTSPAQGRDGARALRRGALKKGPMVGFHGRASDTIVTADPGMQGSLRPDVHQGCSSGREATLPSWAQAARLPYR